MRYWLLGFVFLFLISCQENQSKQQTSSKKNTEYPLAQKNKDLFSMVFLVPNRGEVFKPSVSVKVSLSFSENITEIDSITYFLNKESILCKDSVLINPNFKAGQNTLKAVAYVGQKEVIAETKIMVISENAPQKHKVKLVKTYPHDVTAYTQGLLFTDDYLYEGTGQPRESMLKKIDLEKNELIQSYNLPGEVFGEGIVLHQDKIYQLTWQSRRAFVYDVKSFQIIHEFEYYTEGWGIANYFDKLIMSDGTPNLYIIDPESFGVIDQLQVCNHIGPINNLNELEWIDGQIWANVYLTNTIVIIDPKTGFVEQELDLSHLVPDTYANPHDNVLNGIAYDKQRNRIFVTGKRWPVLYEIKLEKL